MKEKKRNFPVCLILFSLSLLLLLPISAVAEGDGAWTTTDSPGYIFLVEEDTYNNQKHLVMSVLDPEFDGDGVFWGAQDVAGGSYLLRPLNDVSAMTVSWQFDSDVKATVTVEACQHNCLWPSGKAVTLTKFFGDIKAIPMISKVPKTGQSKCWDMTGGEISCEETGQDGDYQLGVSPAYPPSFHSPYTVHGWTGPRFTDNLDGTVTDNHTDLVWLKNANCFGRKAWNNALRACNELADGTCGLTDGSRLGDWRLPNNNEMRSLVSPYAKAPATVLPKGNPFEGVQNFMYFTSTTYTLESPYTAAWVVWFDSQPTGYGAKDSHLCVWPVRTAE